MLLVVIHAPVPSARARRPRRPRERARVPRSLVPAAIAAWRVPKNCPAGAAAANAVRPGPPGRGKSMMLLPSLPREEAPCAGGAAARRRASALALAMGAHPRLGALSPVQRLGGTLADVVAHVMSFVPVVVPDDADTVREALEVARQPGQRIVIRKGEYIVGARPGETGAIGGQSGATILRVRHAGITIEGEPGACLKGMLLFEAGSRGTLVGLTLQDAGDCCAKLGGDARWAFERCTLVCGHACALRVEVHAHASLVGCALGGEGHVGVAAVHSAYGSVQQRGLAKHACYGLFVKDRGTLCAVACEVRHCSEAGLFVADAARVRLSRCRVSRCRVAFVSGYGGGAELRARACEIALPAGGRLWFDDDRPALFAHSAESDEEDAESEGSAADEAVSTLCMACMRTCAQCECGDGAAAPRTVGG